MWFAASRKALLVVLSAGYLLAAAVPCPPAMPPDRVAAAVYAVDRGPHDGGVAEQRSRQGAHPRHHAEAPRAAEVDHMVDHMADRAGHDHHQMAGRETTGEGSRSEPVPDARATSILAACSCGCGAAGSAGASPSGRLGPHFAQVEDLDPPPTAPLKLASSIDSLPTVTPDGPDPVPIRV